jgi:hypothetical protein
LNSIHGETSGKDAENGKQRALVGGEQVVGPIEDGAEGLVTGGDTFAAFEEFKALVQTVHDFAEGERVETRGGEFEREGQTVETTAELCYIAGVFGGECKGVLLKTGAVGKEAHGFERGKVL